MTMGEIKEEGQKEQDNTEYKGMKTREMKVRVNEKTIGTTLNEGDTRKENESTAYNYKTWEVKLFFL